MLLVLDDASGHEQITPLLPGTGGSLVLVTSRRHLTALEDTHVVSLDILPPDDAAALLVRLAARPGPDSGDSAVREITRLCGYLPLAVGMIARQLHHHPAWTPGGLASDLAAAHDRLEFMRAENLSVAAAFDLSYQDLPSASSGCSAAWACTRAPTSTPMPQPRSMTPASRLPGVTWQACTTHTCLPSPALAAIGCTT